MFITPRDFVKATSAVPLNRLLYATGTITDFVDLGDLHLFDDASPNCAIWRFELNNHSRRTRYSALGPDRTRVFSNSCAGRNDDSSKAAAIFY